MNIIVNFLRNNKKNLSLLFADSTKHFGIDSLTGELFALPASRLRWKYVARESLCTANPLMLHVRAVLSGGESALLELEVRVVNSSTSAPGAANNDEHDEDHARELLLKMQMERSSNTTGPGSATFPYANITNASRENAIFKQPNVWSESAPLGPNKALPKEKWLSSSSPSDSRLISLRREQQQISTPIASGLTSASPMSKETIAVKTLAASDNSTMAATVLKVVAGVVCAGGAVAAVAVAAKILQPKLAPCTNAYFNSEFPREIRIIKLMRIKLLTIKLFSRDQNY